jgi:putative iron-dependent peroxidase
VVIDPHGEPVVQQPVLSGLTPAAIFLVATVEEGGAGIVRAVLAELVDLSEEVAALAPDGALKVVAGIGAEAYDSVIGGESPSRLHVLEPVSGRRHSFPSTPGDLLFHIRAQRMDLCYEIAYRLTTALAGAVTWVDEVHGFAYFDQRNVMGFVDGTANPEGTDADEAVFGDGAGTYVVVQKYLHDLAAWHTLSVAEQERVIGRTKVEDIEFADDVKPTNSHVGATELVEADGTEREIVRQNMPFGSPGSGEFGTYFIGYAADPSVIERMLVNMFVGRPEGNYDRILDFSTAVTGTLFYVPSAAELAALAAPEPPAAEAIIDLPTDDSLGIGSLKHLLGKAVL